jgi:hypothetical protein
MCDDLSCFSIKRKQRDQNTVKCNISKQRRGR